VGRRTEKEKNRGGGQTIGYVSAQIGIYEKEEGSKKAGRGEKGGLPVYLFGAPWSAADIDGVTGRGGAQLLWETGIERGGAVEALHRQACLSRDITKLVGGKRYATARNCERSTSAKLRLYYRGRRECREAKNPVTEGE